MQMLPSLTQWLIWTAFSASVFAAPMPADSTTVSTANSTGTDSGCTNGAFACMDSTTLGHCNWGVWETTSCATGLVCTGSDSSAMCDWPSDSSSAGVTAQNVVSSTSATVATATVVTATTVAASATSTSVSSSNSGTSSSSGTSVTSSSTTPVAEAATGSISSTSSATGGALTGPKYVIYMDEWSSTFPTAAELAGYNVLNVAFWMTTTGAVDQALAWTQLTNRQSVIADYHKHGIRVMLSAFGATDAAIVSSKNPTQVANDLATFVKKYGFDGVDIDFEDFDAMNAGTAVAWLVTFQKQLRSLLPAGQYMISHAPVAPWFGTSTMYKDQAYLGFHKKVGNLVDWYNIQFYNQKEYTTCAGLLTQSTSQYPKSSVFEIAANGVALSKIVIGKPQAQGDANGNDGYMSPTELRQCLTQAHAKGYNSGLMYWQWHKASSPGVMTQVAGGIFSGSS